MILSGLLFNFDKLNGIIATKGKVPVVADLMTSRWAYEAMATYQFKNNDYEATLYKYEKEEAKADFKAAYLADELKKRNLFVLENFESKNDSLQKLVATNLSIIYENLKNEPFRMGLEKIDLSSALDPANYSKVVGALLTNYFEDYRKHYQKTYNDNVSLIEKRMAFDEKNGVDINHEKNKYYNESLADLVKNINTKERLLEYNGKLIQQINPIFQETNSSNPMDYRTAFFLPQKNFAGISIDTYWFNLLVIWMMALVLYLALYFEWLRNLIDLFGKVNIPNKVAIPFKRK
jgi:hypothetical protein